MNKKAFTLIELIVVIAIIGILTAFVLANLGDGRSAATDAVRKNDISNIFTSIVGKQTLGELSYPDITSTIEEGKTNVELQSFIDQFLSTTPYDPDSSKAYLYTGNGSDFSVAAILDDGTCFIKSTGENLFGSALACTAFTSGGIGLVQNFMLLHGNTYVDMTWSIPSTLSSLPNTDISSAIICLDSAEELDSNSLPSDDYIFDHGTVVAVVNNAVNQYRITLDNPDHYYYCKAYSYDNNVITNPGAPGSSPNTSSTGFSTTNRTSYSTSSPSTYTPSEASNPPDLGGKNTSGGSTSPAFRAAATRNPDGTGNITLTWVPGYLSTHTIIRRMDNTPPESIAPQSLTDGTQVYNERNDKDGQDPTDIHTYTDTGLADGIIYCYSAWAYDERTNMYSNGFVLACGGVPPSDASGLSMTSTVRSFNLSWTKGSGENTVIRRNISTPAANQEEGVAVYNGSAISFTDNDSGLLSDTEYCYSAWSYNPVTAALSTNHVSACGMLAELGVPSSLTFPTIAYNSIVLDWALGAGTTNTLIVRKQGSIPTSMSDGTQIYNDNGDAFIDTGLTDNTQYCYALYGTDGTDYSDPLTGCATTLDSIDGACGTANGRTFASTDTSYGSYTQCGAGTPSSTAFPATGATANWICNGVNGGNNSVQCSASREAPLEVATCYPVDYNKSKVVNGATVWCDNNGGMWSNDRGSMTAANGAAHCSSLNYAGTTGWALPTKDQLNQCYGATNCQVAGSVAYWSSTVYPDWDGMNWYVNLGQSGAGYNGANFTTSSYNIRCRHTSLPPASCSVAEYNTSKVINGDTVWCDGNGGMWTNDRGAMNWDTANSHCANLAYAGRYGWSLPSRTSLGQCCSSTVCRTSTKNTFWTITTFTDPNMVLKYYINLADGAACYNGANTTNVSYRVRCRLGQ